MLAMLAPMELGGCISVVALATFVAVLVLASVWDLRTRRIPNQLIAVALVAWLVPVVVGLFAFAPDESALAAIALPGQGLLGAVALGGGVLAFALAYERITGRFALGGGDIKLIFVMGLYLGLERGLWALLTSCLMGAVLGLAWQRMGKGDAFPFGPAISLGALVVLLLGFWAC